MTDNKTYDLNNNKVVVNLQGRYHHDSTEYISCQLTANLLVTGGQDVCSQKRTDADNSMRSKYNYTASDYRFSMYNINNIGIFISSAFMPDIPTSSRGTNSSTILINCLSYLKINFKH